MKKQKKGGKHRTLTITPLGRLLLLNAELLEALTSALPLIGPCLYAGKKPDCACQTCTVKRVILKARGAEAWDAARFNAAKGPAG